MSGVHWVYSSGGVRLWGRLVLVDVDVVLVYRGSMIGGVLVVVKGVFWGICRWMREGGREWGNAKAQGRNEEEGVCTWVRRRGTLGYS